MKTLVFIREGDFMEYYAETMEAVEAASHTLGVPYTKARAHGPRAGQWQVGVPVHRWYGAKQELEAAGFKVRGEP